MTDHSSIWIHLFLIVWNALRQIKAEDLIAYDQYLVILQCLGNMKSGTCVKHWVSLSTSSPVYFLP